MVERELGGTVRGPEPAQAVERGRQPSISDQKSHDNLEFHGWGLQRSQDSPLSPGHDFLMSLKGAWGVAGSMLPPFPSPALTCGLHEPISPQAGVHTPGKEALGHKVPS